MGEPKTLEGGVLRTNPVAAKKGVSLPFGGIRPVQRGKKLHLRSLDQRNEVSTGPSCHALHPPPVPLSKPKQLWEGQQSEHKDRGCKGFGGEHLQQTPHDTHPPMHVGKMGQLGQGYRFTAMPIPSGCRKFTCERAAFENHRLPPPASLAVLTTKRGPAGPIQARHVMKLSFGGAWRKENSPAAM